MPPLGRGSGEVADAMGKGMQAPSTKRRADLVPGFEGTKRERRAEEKGRQAGDEGAGWIVRTDAWEVGGTDRMAWDA